MMMVVVFNFLVLQEVQERWELIQKALNREFSSSHDVKVS